MALPLGHPLIKMFLMLVPVLLILHPPKISTIKWQLHLSLFKNGKQLTKKLLLIFLNLLLPTQTNSNNMTSVLKPAQSQLRLLINSIWKMMVNIGTTCSKDKLEAKMVSHTTWADPKFSIMPMRSNTMELVLTERIATNQFMNKYPLT